MFEHSAHACAHASVQLASLSSCSSSLRALSSCVIGPISVYFLLFDAYMPFLFILFLSPAVRYSLLAHQYLIRSEDSLIYMYIDIIIPDRKNMHLVRINGNRRQQLPSIYKKNKKYFLVVWKQLIVRCLILLSFSLRIDVICISVEEREKNWVFISFTNFSELSLLLSLLFLLFKKMTIISCYS